MVEYLDKSEIKGIRLVDKNLQSLATPILFRKLNVRPSDGSIYRLVVVANSSFATYVQHLELRNEALQAHQILSTLHSYICEHGHKFEAAGLTPPERREKAHLAFDRYYKFAVAQRDPIRYASNVPLAPYDIECMAFRSISPQARWHISMVNSLHKFVNLRAASRFRIPSHREFHHHQTYQNWAMEHFGITFEQSNVEFGAPDILLVAEIAQNTLECLSTGRLESVDVNLSQEKEKWRWKPEVFSSLKELSIQLAAHDEAVPYLRGKDGHGCQFLEKLLRTMLGAAGQLHTLHLDAAHRYERQARFLQCKVYSVPLQLHWPQLRVLDLQRVKVAEQELCDLASSKAPQLKILRLKDVHVYALVS